MSEKRDKYLRKKYGVTLEQYNQMLEEQNHCCAICGKHKSQFSRSLHLDHNHKTGRPRGILCFYCNKRLVGAHTIKSVMKVLNYFLRNEV
jgi:hypothetical protein